MNAPFQQRVRTILIKILKQAVAKRRDASDADTARALQLTPQRYWMLKHNSGNFSITALLQLLLRLKIPVTITVGTTTIKL